VTRHYFTSLPVVLAATALGWVLNRRKDGRRFLVCIHVGLVVIGGMLATHPEHVLEHRLDESRRKAARQKARRERRRARARPRA
jgi:hypothetical protein